MSERSVIISVLIALLLLGAYLLVDHFRKPVAADPIALMTFDSAAVERIELVGSTAIQREEVLGSPRWMVHWTTPAGDKATWPADESRVRAGLRVLISAPIVPTDLPIQRSASLRIVLMDGSSELIHFDQQPMAGRIVIEKEPDEGRPVRGYVDAAIFSAFVETGLGAWRSPAALAPFATGPSLIELSSGTGSLTLTRRDARWALAEPINVPADADASRSLALTLAGVEVLAFRDDLTRADDRTGLDTPLATIITETEVRRGDGSLLRQSIVVGGATNLGGKSVFAELAWSLVEGNERARFLAGPVIAELATESLNALSTRVEPYVSRRGATFANNTVERIIIRQNTRSLALERSGLGWTTRQAALLPGDAAIVTTLLETLTVTTADQVRLTSALATDSMTVSLHMGIGPAAATFSIVPLTDPPGILALDGRVARGYATDANFLSSLSDLLAREGQNEPGADPQEPTLDDEGNSDSDLPRGA
ncbi:MAG: DUF4340 domain-containing protein [Phycisphaeraceae bacterium]|nr:DUF4340 domain-containing protein [Phycisphaeraceae bacterium]MCW5762069.1 DUF4340 domain-containing protein [Phycisphaeraceae bacterium]